MEKIERDNKEALRNEERALQKNPFYYYLKEHRY